MREYLRDVAGPAGWVAVEDAAGNMVLRVPGRAELAGAEPLLRARRVKFLSFEHSAFAVAPLAETLSWLWRLGYGCYLIAGNAVFVPLTEPWFHPAFDALQSEHNMGVRF